MKELLILPGDHFDGIVQLFTKKARGKINKYITAEGSSYGGWGPASTVLDYSIKGTDKKDQWVSSEYRNQSYITFTFTVPVFLTNYTIRARTHPLNESMPKNWVVEESNDKENWINIDTKSNREEFKKHGDVATFECDSPTQFAKYIRLRLTSPTNGNNWWFHISRIEFFGKMNFDEMFQILFKRTCARVRKGNLQMSLLCCTFVCLK